MLLKQDYEIFGKNWKKMLTRYIESEAVSKARILYFHGGGLLYGSREDLPEGHIRLFAQAGYEILAFDYPLAPAADLQMILEDVCDSINLSCKKEAPFTDGRLPYFLWGRSAGAYLCLLAASGKGLEQAPEGILSYYGYGFLCDNWFDHPSSYYCQLPAVSDSCLARIPQFIHTEGELDSHYSVYVYARQSGRWKDLIYQGREKFFYLDYTLRTCEQLSCPIFAAHSTNDTDVPYSEFTEICRRYHAVQFIVPGTLHDFDREPDNPFTPALLDATLQFLEDTMSQKTGERIPL